MITCPNFLHRRRAAILAALILLAQREAPAATPPASNLPPGFVALFDGQDLSGWRGQMIYDPRKLAAMSEPERERQVATWTAATRELNPRTGRPHWYAEGGELVNDGFGACAATEREYGDFELVADYKAQPLADSGIFLRGYPQVQVWDHTHSDPGGLGYARGSGGLWNNPAGAPGKDPLVLADKPFGEWNHFRILMVGSRVSVWLNGRLVVDHAILENYYDRNLSPALRRPILARGPIELQSGEESGEVRWRNLFIREIGSDEACRILAAHGARDFQPIFNGKDLAGWAGAVEQVAVRNGSIVWGKGNGTLYWNRELANFQARVEFKIPPLGNNGLAIRYPGTGIPAFDGMCEVQIRDDYVVPAAGPKSGPRHADGSAYGMVASFLGYQHPPGEWNFEAVTVENSHLKVELNGTVILDTDLSQVDRSKLERPHPGKDRTRGFFGFAGHSDPVEFRSVLIRPL